MIDFECGILVVDNAPEDVMSIYIKAKNHYVDKEDWTVIFVNWKENYSPIF